MRGTKPPEGYQLFVYPKYILKKGETVRIELGKTAGEILSIFMGARDVPITAKDIVAIVYHHKDDCGPVTQWRVINSFVHQLKGKLRENGIILKLESRLGVSGMRFQGFGECEPTKPVKAEKPKKLTRNPEAKTTYQLKRLRPKPPKPAPFPQGRKKKRTGRPFSNLPKELPPQYVTA
jgi:hypothetical protein